MNIYACMQLKLSDSRDIKSEIGQFDEGGLDQVQ